jgi:hypothetical protein
MHSLVKGLSEKEMIIEIHFIYTPKMGMSGKQLGEFMPYGQLFAM